MCGISGVLHHSDDIISILYESLFNLQHRGQDSSGLISFSMKTKITYKSKELGLVNNHVEKLSNMEGNMGIGHVRYPTTGMVSRKEIQPFFISKPYGISLVHNGNITNKDAINEILEKNNIYINGTSDSEMILNLFYIYIEKDITKLTNEIIISTIKEIYNLCEGCFSIIIMINDYGLIAFRDKYGIRPLVFEKNENMILICSETIALTSLEYTNIENGEIVIVNKNMDMSKHKIMNEPLIPCLFEYIYFARQESYINDILVYKLREKLGEKMVDLIGNIDIDIVIPVPLTSLISATSLAYKMKKPIKHAIIKNRYIYRTFINSSKEEILKNIKKIRIIKELVYNKNILVVDDSIVRGNTSRYIVKELRKAGANKIYFASCSPPIRNPNKYGIAIPTYKELVAYNRTEKEIEEYIGVDKLYYLDLDIFCESLRELNPNLKDFETSVFTGKYIHKIHKIHKNIDCIIK